MRATPSTRSPTFDAWTRGELGDDLVNVAAQEWLDDAWMFRMLVPSAHEARPGPPGPVLHETLRPLARYLPARLQGELAVYGATLTREVDASDWLAASPVLSTKRIVDTPQSQRRAAQATVDAQWDVGAERWCGRFSCIKSGSRMFLMACSARREQWSELLPQVEVAFESFEPMKPPPQRYAEPLRSYSAESPIPWHAQLPASWLLEPGTHCDDAASFQAENLFRSDGGRGQLVGKLAFAVLARKLHETARDAAELYLDAVRAQGLDVGEDQVELEPPRAPYVQSWCLRAPVWHDDLPGELRCRIMLHADVWVVAGLLSVRREDDITSWMQNKRAIDIVTRSLRFTA